MEIDQALIAKFEEQLDPQNLESSKIKARLIGFGEISSIFELESVPGVVFKRMPMFPDTAQAKDYLEKYRTYCGLLAEAGVRVPEDGAVIVEKSPELTVLYFAQKKFDACSIGNRVVESMSMDEIGQLAGKIFGAIYGIWEFNRNNEELELAIDSQLSNWAYVRESGSLFFIDTSTPLFKVRGREQLNPELFLTSAPSFGRAIIRKFFLKDVMDRYYDEKKVNLDMIGNLHKEHKPELIPLFVETANRFATRAITEKEVADYYREDKFIWQLFLSLRKIDRWLYKNVYREEYQFILPGKVSR